MAILSRTLKWHLLLVGTLLAVSAYGETYYCDGGKQLKCLGFEQKIVPRNSVCLDPLECDQRGFVCKSELDELTGEYASVQRQYKDLADTHNQLIEAYDNSKTAYEDLQRCITEASTLDAAKACL
jgi:hypothetical protein